MYLSNGFNCYLIFFFQFLVVNQKFFNYNIGKADANLSISKFCLWRGSAVFQHFTRAPICYFRVVLIRSWLNLVSLHWMCLKPNKGSRVPVLPASCTAPHGGGSGWGAGHPGTAAGCHPTCKSKKHSGGSPKTTICLLISFVTPWP